MALIRTAAALSVLLAFTGPLWADDDDAKEAMQALQDYVGKWKGNGTSEKNKSEIWKEEVTWSWKFKDKEAYFAADMPESKQYKSAELKYNASKKRYELTFVTRMDKKQVFQGELKKGRLALEHVDDATKDTQQIVFNTAADGDRLIMTYAVRAENRTLFNKTQQLAYTRDGVTFAASGAKKNECVVTGGLGTSTVSYKGVTYWVCCSGCRDAFNENPEKIIKEYLARKKAEK